MSELRSQAGAIHEEMPLWIDSYLESQRLAWQQLERGDLWGKPELPFAGLEDLQMWLVCRDPVRFAECTLVERDLDGQPAWRLWDYQKAAARYRGSAVFQCGAEVGKTRDIVVLVIWRAMTMRGDQLVAGALDGHIDQIWREIIGQAKLNPWIRAHVDWDATHIKPYKDLVWKNGNAVFFRPAGVDGSAFRSIHVKGAAYLDEAAKVKSSEAFGNFLSRAKPGCEIRIYSVPDGDRSSQFFQICNRVPEVDPLRPPFPPSGSSSDGPIFIKFRWSKTMQPDPYWSENRHREQVDLYGGIDTAEYQQNVLGNWGDPSSSVFPWARFKSCVLHVPEYVFASLLHDEGTGELHVTGHRLNALYQLRAVGDENGEAGPGPMSRFFGDLATIGQFEGASLSDRVDRWEEYLRPLLPRVVGSLACAADVGSTTDPTEILFLQPIGHRRRFVGRLQLRHFGYDDQDAIIRAVDRILRPSHGWAIDATGVGTALEHLLSRENDGHWIDVTGVVMNAKTEDLDDESGEPVVDSDTGRPRRVTFKELGTRLLEHAMQRGHLEVPHDPDFLIQFPGHTAKKLPSGARKFKNTDDHLVDAGRVGMLRLHLLDVGTGVPEVDFASEGSRDTIRELSELAHGPSGFADWILEGGLR